MSETIYPDHGWRIDEYGMIRNGLGVSISRGWCDEAERDWRWHIFGQEDCNRIAGGACKTVAECKLAVNAWFAANAESPYNFAWLPPDPTARLCACGAPATVWSGLSGDCDNCRVAANERHFGLNDDRF